MQRLLTPFAVDMLSIDFSSLYTNNLLIWGPTAYILKEMSIEQKRILTVFKVTLKVPRATASFKSPIAIRGSNGRFPPATTPEWKRLSPKHLFNPYQNLILKGFSA